MDIEDGKPRGKHYVEQLVAYLDQPALYTSAPREKLPQQLQILRTQLGRSGLNLDDSLETQDDISVMLTQITTCALDIISSSLDSRLHHMMKQRVVAWMTRIRKLEGISEE